MRRTTRHASPRGAVRTRQMMTRRGYVLRGYGFEDSRLVLVWGRA